MFTEFRPRRATGAFALFVPVALCAGLLGISPQEELSLRVASLEQTLQAQELRLGALDTENKGLNERIERCTRALDGQTKAIDSLLAALDRSEAAGFTAGINPRSREELLAGFRGYLAALKEGLAAPAKPAQKPAKLPAAGQSR